MTVFEFIAIFSKFFFILTPFFIIAVFLAMTDGQTDQIKRALAVRITIGVVVISIVLLTLGDLIFSLFGITVDAFRIGAGALLFLTAVSLSRGEVQLPHQKAEVMDLAIVPLAIPTTLGPGSVGALMVMGNETHDAWHLALTAGAVSLAGIAVGVLLFCAPWIRSLIGRSGISMLSKLTGLILAALSCQMMFTGIAAFLSGNPA